MEYRCGTRLGPVDKAGKEKQWLDDVSDLTGLKLPEAVTLAGDGRKYKQFVHRVVQAPHGV